MIDDIPLDDLMRLAGVALPSDRPDHACDRDLKTQTVRSNRGHSVLDADERYQVIDLLKFVDPKHRLARLSRQIADETSLPVSTVFMAFMAVFASMACRRWCVLYANGQRLPIGLFVIAEQPSGVGKTRCLNAAQEPFRSIQSQLIHEAELAISDLEGGLQTQEIKSDIQKKLSKLSQLKVPLFITNATSEGIEKNLAHTFGAFSAASSEQGVLNSLLGISYGTPVNNNDVMLNAFDGGYVSSQRVTREAYSGHVFGGVICFAQSGGAEKALDVSKGTGVSERFIILAEPHSLGKRDHLKQIACDRDLFGEYKQCCSFFYGVLREPRPFLQLETLVLSRNGHDLIAGYRNKIEPYLADGGKFSHISLRGAAAKVDMQIMKIAANLHLLDGWGRNPEIADNYVKSAIHIAHELLNANLRFCRDHGLIGIKAEYTSILTLFEDKSAPRTERNIIQVKNKTKPFSEFTGNKSDLIRKCLKEMVDQGLLIKMEEKGGRVSYGLGQ